MKDPRIGGKTVNDILLDLALEHGVSIERLKSSEVRKALDLLAEVDEELLTQIAGRVERLGPVERQQFGRGKYTTKRLQKLRDTLRELADESYAIFIGELRSTLDGVAKQSAQFERDALSKTINLAISADYSVTAVSASSLRSIVRTRPIDGEHLQPFVKRWSETKRRLVEQEIRKGVLANETVSQIVRRINGPEAFVRSRRGAEAIVRTSVQTITEASRQEVWQANSDIIKGVRWVATLDNRTCVLCGPLDGKVYKIDDGPRPPRHPNCRCVTVAVTTASKVPGERAGAFGPVPSDVTFDEFMRQRGASFQDDVLGKTKARLYRKGGVKLDDFVDKSGREFTLDDLASRNASAFKRAGLDPADFRDAA